MQVVEPVPVLLEAVRGEAPLTPAPGSLLWLCLLLLLVHLFQLLFQHPLLLRLGELGEQKGELYAHAPRRASRGIRGVAKKLCGDVHRLKSDLHDSSHATTERHGPYVAAARSPVGGEDGRRGDVPTMLHVVVNGVLQQELIDRRTATRTGGWGRCP